MGTSTLKTVANLDILGVNFSFSGKYDDFINNIIQNWSMFALSGIGMSYPVLNTLNKVNLFKSICRPTLMYGVDCLNLTKNNLKDALLWNMYVENGSILMILGCFSIVSNVSRSNYCCRKHTMHGNMVFLGILFSLPHNKADAYLRAALIRI